MKLSTIVLSSTNCNSDHVCSKSVFSSKLLTKKFNIKYARPVKQYVFIRLKIKKSKNMELCLFSMPLPIPTVPTRFVHLVNAIKETKKT